MLKDLGSQAVINAELIVTLSVVSYIVKHITADKTSRAHPTYLTLLWNKYLMLLFVFKLSNVNKTSIFFLFVL